MTWSQAISGTNNPATFAVTNATPTVGALFAEAPFPTIVSQPTNIAVVVGNSAVFSVTAAGAEPLSYQWRKGGAEIPGANFSTYTISNTVAGDAGNYDVVIANVYGSRITSAVATLTILLPPVITQQPTHCVVVQASNTTFSVTATGTAPLAYQWRKNGTAIGGAVSSTYTLLGVTTNDAGVFDLVVSNPYGAVTSSPAILTVVLPPFILVHPTNRIAATGSGVIFAVAAGGTEPLAYQWFKNSAGVASGTNANLTLSPVQLGDAGNYFVVVSNPYGAVTSAVATLTVYVPVAITSEPVSTIAPAKGTAWFSVGAIGVPAPNYQWVFNDQFIPAANANTLVITNVGLQHLGGYSVIVWNAYSIATSSVATLYMSPSLQVPFAGNTAVWGKEATLSVSAIGSGTLSYQWYKDGEAIAGATGATLVLRPVQMSDAGMYSVVVSSDYGNVTNTPAQLVVNPANIALGLFAGIIIDGVTGYTYGIEYTTDLRDTNSWVFVTNVTLTQPVEIWVDTSVDVQGPATKKRYYRVLPASP